MVGRAGLDPTLIEAWCELGYVVTEDNRHLFSAGDMLTWKAAVRRHVDNFGDEGDLDGENEIHALPRARRATTR
jgi:hypothetical protein